MEAQISSSCVEKTALGWRWRLGVARVAARLAWAAVVVPLHVLVKLAG